MKKIFASAGLVALSAAVSQASPVLGSGTADKLWDVSLTVRGFYDDNYNCAPSGSPLKRDSFGVEVSPTVGIALSGQQTSFSAHYTYDMRYYDDRKQNTADHSHEFNAWLVHTFSERYSVNLADTFVIAQEPQLIDPSLGTVSRSNGNNIHNSGKIQFHAQVTRLLEVVLGYRNELFDYESKDYTAYHAFFIFPAYVSPSYAGLLNRLEHYANIDLRWQLQPETIGVLGYQLGITDYTGNQPIGTSSTPNGEPILYSDSRNFRSHYVYIGADHSFLQHLTGSVRGGAEFVDFYNAHSSAVSPYVDASIRYTYRTGSFVELGVKHNRNATDASALDQETTAAYGSITHAFTAKLIGNLNGQYQNSSFNQGPYSSESDNIYMVGASLEYLFNRHLSAEVGYNYDKADSNITGRGYDRNRVYLGMTASY